MPRIEYKHPIRALRERLDRTQTDFWSPLGVTQTAASRYESGDRPIPRPVQLLLLITYGTPSKRASVLKRLSQARQ